MSAACSAVGRNSPSGSVLKAFGCSFVETLLLISGKFFVLRECSGCCCVQMVGMFVSKALAPLFSLLVTWTSQRCGIPVPCSLFTVPVFAPLAADTCL